MVAALYDKDPEIRQNAYNMIRTELSTSTSSMTSIPRPLKFLRLHYDELKEYVAKLNGQQDQDFKHSLIDLLAVLVMVAPNATENSLSFVLAGSKQNLTQWGLEFIRNLSGDISNEFVSLLDQDKPTDELLSLVNIIVPYLIETHSESEAVDLLIEVEKLDSIMDFVNQNNYKRICLYLLACANYAADSDEMKSILEITYNIYQKYNEHANALRVAIKLNNQLFIKQTFLGCNDSVMQKQLAFILGKEKIYIENEGMSEDLQAIMSNLKLTEYYKKLAGALEVTEPKHPEEMFKSHLEEKKSADAKIDSYKINMATSIASSFINAGHGSESLLSNKDKDWLNRNKEEGLLALLAGLGLVNLWDIEVGPNELEKYMNSNEMDPNKRGGYNIGVGVISSGVRDENNIAFGILSEQLKDKK